MSLRLEVRWAPALQRTAKGAALRPGHAHYPLAAPTLAKRRRMRINSWSQTSR